MFSSTVARFILLTVFTKFDFLAEVVTDLNVVRGPAVIQQKEEEKHESHHNGFSMKVTASKPFQKAVDSRLKPCVVAGCEKKEQKVWGGRQVGGRQAASSAGKVLDERKQEEQEEEQEEEEQEEEQQDKLDTQLWLATYHSYFYSDICMVYGSIETYQEQTLIYKFCHPEINIVCIKW